MSVVATPTQLNPDVTTPVGGARRGADFDGQYLTLVVDLDIAARPTADSVLVDVRDGARHGYRVLLVADAGRGPAVQLELTTDFSDTPLRVYAPLDRIGLGQHQLALRYARTTLDLYVDGVLMDEEFPIGRVALPGNAESTVGGGVATVREFHRALDPAEIAALAGGDVEALRQRYVGSWTQPAWGMQYWRTSGHNEYVADTQPVYADGAFHVYFQHGRRSHGNKWKLGAHDKGHVSSRDLKHWELHPIALGITEEWEGSLATGCTYFEDGTYYMFYTTRRPDRTQVVDLATSTDGLIFTKLGSSPMIEPKPPYRVGPFRDPRVFKDDDGRYHMLVTAGLADENVDDHCGTLAHVSSPDLYEWTLEKPFLTPGYRGHEPECPDIFEWNGRYYLLFSQHGVAHYRIGESYFGPWTTPAVDTLDGVFVRVMQTAPFENGRRIGTAFLTPPGVFGGALIFREILQRPDGTLGSAFPVELTPRGKPQTPRFEALGAGASGSAETVTLAAPQGLAVAALRGIGSDVRITATVEISEGTLAFGLILGGTENMRGGHELRCDVNNRTVAWRLPSLKVWEGADSTSLQQVDGLTRTMTLEIVRLGDVLDVCINGDRTLAALQPADTGTDGFLFVQDGMAKVSDIIVEILETT